MNDIQTQIDTRCGSEYQKIKMSDINQFVCQARSNNGLLNDIKNDLFQVLGVLTSFSLDFFKISSFAIFHSLEVHFMNSDNNDQMFVGPLSIKMKLSRALKT